MVAGALRDTGFRFAVRLTPKGGRDRLDGWVQGADGKRYLKARVSAPPEDGKANEALLRLLAKALGVGTTKVRIVSGTASRLKMIEAEADPSRLALLDEQP
jgi:uncharacterized protein (TIGR00251 family)